MKAPTQISIIGRSVEPLIHDRVDNINGEITAREARCLQLRKARVHPIRSSIVSLTAGNTLGRGHQAW